MVMTPQISTLPTSNGHSKAEKAPDAGKFHIDISGLEEGAYEDAYNQVNVVRSFWFLMKFVVHALTSCVDYPKDGMRVKNY